MAWSKNSRVGRGGVEIQGDNSGCLRRYNYATGAGWKSNKKAKISGKPSSEAFNIKRKKRGGRW